VWRVLSSVHTLCVLCVVCVVPAGDHGSLTAGRPPPKIAWRGLIPDYYLGGVGEERIGEERVRG
jgi:hypothetical protein